MTLVAGSYERFLWGWHVGRLKYDTLKPIFCSPVHKSAVKCMAMAGPVLVTGGTNEIIKIFDFTWRSEMGILSQHKGTITSLCLFREKSSGDRYPRLLLSGSLDGTICMWDTQFWANIETMKAHRNGVNDLCIHPSGVLALSVGRDSHLNMYNLAEKRCELSAKLQSEASLIRFNSKGGETFSVVTDKVVSIHNAEDAKVLYSFDHGKRALCLSPSVVGYF
eukprot:Gb_16773 [translate_table: standard]